MTEKNCIKGRQVPPPRIFLVYDCLNLWMQRPWKQGQHYYHVSAHQVIVFSNAYGIVVTPNLLFIKNSRICSNSIITKLVYLRGEKSSLLVILRYTLYKEGKDESWFLTFVYFLNNLVFQRLLEVVTNEGLIVFQYHYEFMGLNTPCQLFLRKLRFSHLQLGPLQLTFGFDTALLVCDNFATIPRCKGIWFVFFFNLRLGISHFCKDPC